MCMDKSGHETAQKGLAIDCVFSILVEKSAHSSIRDENCRSVRLSEPLARKCCRYPDPEPIRVNERWPMHGASDNS